MIFLGMLVFAFSRRPFIAPYDMAMYVSIAGLEFVSCVCAFVITSKGKHAGEEEKKIGGGAAIAATAVMVHSLYGKLRTQLQRPKRLACTMQAWWVCSYQGSKKQNP
eukprot:gene3749-2521_t